MMLLNQFNEEFYPFYAQFGYKSSGTIPENVDLSRFGVDTVKQLDDLKAVLQEHTATTSYFVSLFWRSLRVVHFPCSESQYSAEVIPQSVINAAQNYAPPQLEY